jgi:hypothetical protein
MDQISIVELHKKHIKGTPKKTIVADITIVLCNLTYAVSRGCSFKTAKVYVTSKCLKHLYDKRPAEEYDFVLNNLTKIIKFPDHIYENPTGKRGDISFYKTINGCDYLCAIEKDIEPSDTPDVEVANFIVTCFRSDEDYVKNYKLLWSWKGDNPSS